VTERGAQTRTRLEDAALSLFLEVGWGATTGIAIRTRAGVSQGSWTHAFAGGKPEIAAAIFKGLHTELWDTVLAEIGRGGRRNLNDAVTAGLAQLVRQLRSDPKRYYLLCTLADVLLAESSDSCVRVVKDAAENVEGRLVQALWRYSKQIEPCSGRVAFALLFGPALALFEASCRDNDPVIFPEGAPERCTLSALSALSPIRARQPKQADPDPDQKLKLL
jgi:AcrR family transcriptional regulator